MESRALPKRFASLDDDPNKAKDLAEEAIHGFGAVYKKKSLSMLRAKVGLLTSNQKMKSLLLIYSTGCSKQTRTTPIPLRFNE